MNGRVKKEGLSMSTAKPGFMACSGYRGSYLPHYYKRPVHRRGGNLLLIFFNRADGQAQVTALTLVRPVDGVCSPV